MEQTNIRTSRIIKKRESGMSPIDVATAERITRIETMVEHMITTQTEMKESLRALQEAIKSEMKDAAQYTSDLEKRIEKVERKMIFWQAVIATIAFIPTAVEIIKTIFAALSK